MVEILFLILSFGFDTEEWRIGECRDGDCSSRRYFGLVAGDPYITAIHNIVTGRHTFTLQHCDMQHPRCTGHIVGAGLPILAIGFGVYWLMKRRRKVS